MSIRSRPVGKPKRSAEYERLKRKANQAWELAGLAAQDGDREDAARKTAEAKMYDKQAEEVYANEE